MFKTHNIGSYLSYIMLDHEKNMWQNSENWKFLSSSQQLLKWIYPVLIRDNDNE